MKTFSKIEIAVIKSTAKNAAQYVAKKQKIEAQIAAVEETIRKRVEEKLNGLLAEKEKYQSIIDSLNESVKKITGGYTTEDLISIEKVGTGKMAENGKEIMETRYTLKYPETVVPWENPICGEAPTTKAGPGSDFDFDKEKMEKEIPEEALNPDPEYAAAVEAAETAFVDNQEDW